MSGQPAGDEVQPVSTPSTPPTGSVAENSFGDSDVIVNNDCNKSLNRTISPRMREEDADLLESMHYASSQVSQYTPDGTPLLRPKDRSLPMEDVPLISMPICSTSELLMKKEDDNDTNKNNSTIYSDCDSQSCVLDKEGRGTAGHGWSSVLLQKQQQENSSSERSDNLAMPELLSGCTTYDSQSNGRLSTMEKHSEYSIKSLTKLSGSHQVHSTHLKSQERGVRRLLSGEIRTVAGMDKGENDIIRPQHGNSNHIQQLGFRTILLLEENYETDRREDWIPTTSPISIRQEVSSTKTEQDGMAERRRVSEAIQFAQAVGEQIALNRDDLCIIDDDEDDDDDDDDDENEDNTESKERASSTGLPPITPKEIDQALIVDHETPLSKRSIVQSPKLNRRRKSRPMWPFEQHSDMEFNFINHLSDGIGDRTNFVYKGICANPPEITKRGIQRGNYAQLHRKAWLEVSDKYHRYGKNLRLYYRVWERLDFPTNQFFDWLDSKGEAAGQPLPNIEECPRSVLDSDTVLYITNPNVTERYALKTAVGDDGRCLVVDVDDDPVHTGPDGWIFILRDNVMYGAPKITSVSGHSKQRFHHSSFFGGKAVASAGIIITNNQGYLTRLYPHSGHYRPGEAHMQRMLFFLHRNGVDLRALEMDTQQLLHVSREKEDPKKKFGRGKTPNNNIDGKNCKGKEEKKVKKVDSLHLEKASDVACFLAHKADFIGRGIFDKIHKIRKADVTSVSEALNLVNYDEHSRI